MNDSISGSSSNNYILTQPTVIGTINQAPLTIIASDQSTTYGTSLNLGTTAFTFSGIKNSDTVSSVTLTQNHNSIIPSTQSVGTYTGSTNGIIASNANGSGLSNYIITYSTGTLTINQAPLTVTGTIISIKQYDGTTIATITNGTLNNVIPSDIPYVTLSQSGTYSTPNAGFNIPIVMNDSISGTRSSNYILIQPTVIGTILNLPLTVTDTIVQPKIYDGTTTATITNGILNNVIPLDIPYVTLTQSGTYSNPNVGYSIPMIMNNSIHGTRASNYILIQPIVTGTITPSQPTPSIIITQQPQSVTVYEGTILLLSVQAISSDSQYTNKLSYQWYKNSLIIPNATGTSYIVYNSLSNDGADYYVVISNNIINSIEQSNTATVTVIYPNQIPKTNYNYNNNNYTVPYVDNVLTSNKYIKTNKIISDNGCIIYGNSNNIQILSNNINSNKINTGNISNIGPIIQLYGSGGKNATVGINFDTFQSSNIKNNGRYNGNNPATQILSIDNGSNSSDLIFKTSSKTVSTINNKSLSISQERMRITSEGDVNISNNLNIGNNLNVSENSTFNNINILNNLSTDQTSISNFNGIVNLLNENNTFNTINFNGNLNNGTSTITPTQFTYLSQLTEYSSCYNINKTISLELPLLNFYMLSATSSPYSVVLPLINNINGLTTTLRVIGNLTNNITIYANVSNNICIKNDNSILPSIILNNGIYSINIVSYNNIWYEY
jgi:hypothetical protein